MLRFRLLSGLLTACALFAVLSALCDACRAEEEEAAKPHPFLARFCMDCHTADDPSGEREFTTLDLRDSSLDTQLRLQEIIDQLNLGAMPPEDGEQPSDKERLAGVRSLTATLARMREVTASTGGQTVLRRLSRREYRNTMGDLLGIDMTMFDPTQEFPADDLSENADNIGAALTTSGYLLEKYLQAADACVEKAFALAEPADSRQWEFKDYFYQQPELRTAHQYAFQHRYLVLYDHPLNEKPEGAYGPLHKLEGGVPADGVYEVRVQAQALHRDTPYGERAVFIDRTEPFRMGIRPGDTRIGDLVHTQPIQPKLAETVIADNELAWYTFQVPLDRGFSPRFTFENGQHDVRGAYGRIFRLHRDTLPKAVRGGQGIVEQRKTAVRDGQLPQIRIHQVQIRGPLPDDRGERVRQILFGGKEFSQQAVPKLLAKFASRAYRRPATEAEVDGLLALYKSRIGAGRQPLDAYKDALKAALCSPGFLYLSPPDDTDAPTLSDHALAERLSYFLTSSMPDEQLRRLADEGRLSDAEVLRGEVNRLLDSKASDRFLADFLDSWLKLRDLGNMPPDPQAFRDYYAAGLEDEMKQETRLLLRDLIDRNASVLELLRADYSFVNRDLAKLYGVESQIPVEQAGEFHRVTFDDADRGGLLGQASILTVSANGIETSPVVRGVWLLETVLGAPPPPPPDDVPPIDPDVRGAASIREQLIKHRQSAACNQCHRKIDPLGFALEGFDPIGRSRKFYDPQRRIPIDTSGELPGGAKFSGPGQLRELLLARKDFFVRTVTTRLLQHALGRRIEPTDRPALDAILTQTRPTDYRTRDLLTAIATSKIFRQR
ncbi:MAG: DUF1592 domain-containing protein [Pirellulaceae bacterium]